MMLLNPVQSYPLSQTNLLSVYIHFNGVINGDAYTNGVSQYSSSTAYSASSTWDYMIYSAAPYSPTDTENNSGPVINRSRCVSATVTGYKDIWGTNTNVTLSKGSSAGLYGYAAGPYNPGYWGFLFDYLFSGTSTYISMSGLNVGTYDLYLYAAADILDADILEYCKFTVYSGSTSSSRSTSNNATWGNGSLTVWTENTTYLKFSNHSTADGKINVLWEVAAGSSYGPLNGIQIVQTK